MVLRRTDALLLIEPANLDPADLRLPTVFERWRPVANSLLTEDRRRATGWCCLPAIGSCGVAVPSCGPV
jgi:hypothetical protein